uniref:hypothetical protein n=1 Tax=Candidatus Electronema sp. TaxID=2698783 RepID=UPI004057BAFF
MDIFLPAIAGALGNLASAAVLGAYQAVKTLIQRKFGAESDLADALKKLEKQPDAKWRQDALQGEAAAAGADKDEEIMKAVQVLLDAVKAHAGGIGMDIGTFKAAKLEVSDVVAEEKGTAVRMKEVDIEGTATFSKIGGSRPNQ